MSKFVDYLLHRPNMLVAALLARIGGCIPDQLYLKWRYKLIMGTPFHVKDPKTYNEKINWLKLFDRNPLYTRLADKATVKDYVASRIGESYCIPTIGIYDSFEEINFNALPDKFVIKSTNGGGGTGVIICRNKSKLNLPKVKSQLEASLNSDWKTNREWVYKDIKPRYIIEELLENKDGSDLVDYKFHCFNGVPKLLFVASDRYLGKDTLKFDWYDMELNHLPFKSKGYENSTTFMKPFPEFDEMKKVAGMLSDGIPYVRVDLYLVNGRIYFGEMTFYHDAGFVALQPEEWEYKLGSWIELPVNGRDNNTTR